MYEIIRLIRLQQGSSTAKIIIMVLYDVIRKKRIQEEHGLNRVFGLIDMAENFLFSSMISSHTSISICSSPILNEFCSAGLCRNSAHLAPTQQEV